jgi:hypothetical protein
MGSPGLKTKSCVKVRGDLQYPAIKVGAFLPSAICAATKTLAGLVTKRLRAGLRLCSSSLCGAARRKPVLQER